MTAVLGRYDDPTVSDQQLLERAWQLRLRDSLSRTADEAKARMAAAGCSGTDWAPLTGEEHLELLQIGRWLELRAAQGRWVAVRRAREAGVPWEAIAAALEMGVVDARDEYAAWVDGQQRLHDDIGIGLDDDQAAAAWLLLED